LRVSGDRRAKPSCAEEVTMSHVLHNWIFVGTTAYDEYTFVPWLNKSIYRRTVELSRVCLL
jgi:hypothetical protein